MRALISNSSIATIYRKPKILAFDNDNPACIEQVADFVQNKRPRFNILNDIRHSHYTKAN